MDAETQRQIDLDALLARRLVEKEEEAAQEALATEFDYIQARLNADQILAEKLQQEEREQYYIEDRAKFLHDTIAAQRKFLAEQRSAVIRNKPPTISQLRNQMITYLKHVANKKHAELKSKSFEEIQVMYERYKKQDQTFVAIGTDEDERAIKRMNEKATDKEEEKKDESVHEEVKEAEGAKKRKPLNLDVEILDLQISLLLNGVMEIEDFFRTLLGSHYQSLQRRLEGYVMNLLEEFEDSDDDDLAKSDHEEAERSRLECMRCCSKFDVEKFDGSNDFGLWRVKMRCLLIQHGWETALDSFSETMADAEKTATLKTDVYKKAHSALLLCLDNKVLREVNKEDSAAGFWLKLETLYMTKSLANKLYLKKKLFTFYMHSGKKLSEHIDEFNKLIGDLANIDVDIDDEDQTLMLLTSLPPSYDNFMQRLLYGRESLTSEDVLSSCNTP
ncbi:hypothetical protein Tco_1271019 [Tanacetum coccineum]